MKFLEGTKITYQVLGDVWIIGIRGDSQREIEERFFSFWNHKATNGELQWMNDDKFAYFISNERLFKNSLASAALFYILNHEPLTYKGKKGGAKAVAQNLALQAFSQMEQEHIFNFVPASNDGFAVVEPE
jgi:hypothetical protein